MSGEPERPPKDSNASFERALHAAQPGRYLLRLYVAGSSEKSARAIVNLRQVCEQHLAGRYDMEVIDVLQQPELARAQQIVATPTLIKVLPPPARRVIGDLSQTERVLLGLNIAEAR